IRHASLDSEHYMSDVMEYLRSKGTTFTIAADKDTAVKEAIKGIKEWKPYRDSGGVLTDREIGETVHTMNRLEFSFRLIVLRWRDEQRDLFSDGYNYHCIATDLESPAEEVVWQYNERVNIENVIKELKNGFGMEGMPTGDFGANSFWFSLGVLAYNSFIIKKHFVLPEGLRSKTIQSIRWILIGIAGKVVGHARRLCLKVYAEVEKFILLRKIRLRCVELAT
ncbi:MAG: transposase, partial [Thermodesulfovibrionales bacterium]